MEALIAGVELGMLGLALYGAAMVGVAVGLALRGRRAPRYRRSVD